MKGETKAAAAANKAAKGTVAACRRLPPPHCTASHTMGRGWQSLGLSDLKHSRYQRAPADVSTHTGSSEDAYAFDEGEGARGHWRGRRQQRGVGSTLRAK